MISLAAIGRTIDVDTATSDGSGIVLRSTIFVMVSYVTPSPETTGGGVGTNTDNNDTREGLTSKVASKILVMASYAVPI